MNNHLPKTYYSRQGFTLIELMVVIAILAILAIVGYSIFSSAQGNARDGVRRAEINNLAKSIEGARDVGANPISYKYTATQYANDYPTNLPKDPYKDAAKTLYCVATSATAAVADPTTWANVTDNCPTVPLTTWYPIINNAGAYQATNNAVNTGIRYWKICARLETTGTFFCQANIQ